MALTKFTEKLISDSFKASISGSDTTESSSFASRITLVEGTTSKTLVSSSAQIATDISGSFNSTSSSLASRVTVNEGRVNQGVKTTDSPTFAGGTVTGDFTVGGTLTAQEVHTEFESASILFTSGSTIFGDTSDDVHNMTGSLNVSGAINLNDGNLSITDKMIIGSGSGFDFGNTNHPFTVKSTGNNAGFSVLSSAGGELLRFIQESNDAGKLDIYDGGSLKLRLSAHASENNYINNGGNVGIGTNNPSANLHIGGTTPTIYLGDSGAEDTKLVYRGNQIDYYIGHDDSNNALTMGFGTTVGSDAVLVISGSNVGIGTTSPVSLLYLEEDNTTNVTDAASMISNSSLTINGNSSDGSDVIRMGAMSNATGDYFIEVSNSAGNAAYSLLLNPINGGDVGIGTVTPAGFTHLYTSQRYMLYLESTYGTDRKYWFRNDGGTLQLGEGAQGDSQVAFTFDTANNEFGIGTRGPDGFIDVHSGGSSVFKVQSDGVAVGSANPGTYGQFHVRGTGDTSVTGSTFYDGYGDTGISGNVVGPHTMCLQSTSTATQHMGPSIIFRTKAGSTLDTSTVAAIVGSLNVDPSGDAVETRGALRFFTSAGYTYSPAYGSTMTERMLIDHNGHIYMTSQRRNITFNQDGLAIGNSNGVFMYAERSSGTANSILYLHRRNGDGQHISFYESNAQDGYIQTSSGVVSLVGFQGSHEASGIPIDTPTGTVVSTIDEEFKYRHANVKISDTVGDKRVYGVVENFNEEQSDDTGHTHPAHFNIASVGVGHIRVTGSCAGGDLLESNGDGLAKVQDDDIIRSKTIGKVTANVSGSATEDRLVACVLYCG
jgi:hypothetical protein